MRVAIPDWAEWVRVDEAIECWPIQDATEEELLQLMPDAYGGEAPGEDDWPEPDAKRDEPYKIARIWGRLSEEAREDLAVNYQLASI